MTTTELETRKEKLGNLANEMMASNDPILQNVFYKLAPFYTCADRVSENFVGNYNKVYSVRLAEDEDGFSSIVLTWDLIEKMGIDFEDIKKHAEENTPKFFTATIEPMGEVLSKLMAPSDLTTPISNGSKELYVISNNQKNNGAGVICYPNMLKQISELLDGSFFILPSSVHEVLALSSNMDLSSDDLRKMVSEVNNTIVEPQDLLGYDVVYYDAQSEKLSIA